MLNAHDIIEGLLSIIEGKPQKDRSKETHLRWAREWLIAWSGFRGDKLRQATLAVEGIDVMLPWQGEQYPDPDKSFSPPVDAPRFVTLTAAMDVSIWLQFSKHPWYRVVGVALSPHDNSLVFTLEKKG